jgi:hypothetical protein
MPILVAGACTVDCAKTVLTDRGEWENTMGLLAASDGVLIGPKDLTKAPAERMLAREVYHHLG